MGRATKAAWGWLPNISLNSFCCSPCPQLGFQISCQPPHQNNPLPDKWYRLPVGTTCNLLVSYTRLESHRLTPLHFWRKKKLHLYLAAFLHIPHFIGSAELQRSTYFMSRNEEVCLGFILNMKKTPHHFLWKTGYVDSIKILTTK